MIVCSVGYGYISKYLFRELASIGVITIGITSKNISKYPTNTFDNLKVYSRQETEEYIKISTHLLITAPPNENGCPIYSKYNQKIIDSNISNILYVSSTGVYGNYDGDWVNEESELKGNNATSKRRKLAEKQWIRFSKDNNLSYNIFRLGAIYGPDRINAFTDNKKITKKKGHYFSRIHVYDISRLITEILLNGFKNNIWNLVDNKPSSRESFLLEVANLKKIKNYELVEYKNIKKNLKKVTNIYWSNNKRVSNLKVRDATKSEFLFPSYKSGLKHLLS